MKVNMDIEAAILGGYLITEQRSMARLGDCLQHWGFAVTYNSWATAGDDAPYDVCVWHNEQILPQASEYKWYSDCVNLLYSNGSCSAGLPIDGVLYSQRHAFEASPYRNRFMLKVPFELHHETTSKLGSYVLISGGLFPERNLHIPVMAMNFARSKIPLRIVYQPSKDRPWPSRDPDGLHRALFDHVLAEVVARGVEVVEQDAVFPIGFQDIMRGAAAYVFCDNHGMNALVCQEALMYGVPLIAPANPVDYTDRYRIYPYGHDWRAARSIAEHIDAILAAPAQSKKEALQIARDLRYVFSYKTVGAELAAFFDRLKDDRPSDGCCAERSF